MAESNLESAAVSAVVHPLPRPWQSDPDSKLQVWTAGRLDNISALIACARDGTLAEFGRLLREERQQFGLVVETDSAIFAAADRIAGYPLDIRQSGSVIEISGDSRRWMTSANAADFDEQQARIYLLAGYCIGRNSLMRNVTRVLPGEFVRICKDSGVLSRHRYYRFLPSFAGEGSPAIWERRLGDALDAATERLLSRADGRRIWIPLSAGYDSRLVLAKLLEHGCKKLQAFSYGTAGNMESRVARSLAESVGVPWRFVPPNNKANADDYWGGEAAQYAYYAGGVRTSPAMNEFFAFRSLLSEGSMDSDDFVTNGQTGDFLTGGHIPKNVPTNRSETAHEIRTKHLSLFRSLSDDFGQSGSDELLADWVSDHLDQSEVSGDRDSVRTYLAFEWQERQSQLVVNQQRAYDHLGLKWSLPLWDADLMDLYDEVPFELQQKQDLYIRYLQSWNYRDLFSTLRLPYNPWPRARWAILLMGRLSALIGGGNAKEATYRRLYYFTDYHYLYALFGWRCYDLFHRELRTPASLAALSHLVRLRRALGIEPSFQIERQFMDVLGHRVEAMPLPSSA